MIEGQNSASVPADLAALRALVSEMGGLAETASAGVAMSASRVRNDRARVVSPVILFREMLRRPCGVVTTLDIPNTSLTLLDRIAE